MWSVARKPKKLHLKLNSLALRC